MNLIGKKVKHRSFGVGNVTLQEDKYITVEFESKTSKFTFPDAFEKFLVAEDGSIQTAIASIINEAKAAEATRAVQEEEKPLAVPHTKTTRGGNTRGSGRRKTPASG